MMQRPIFLVVLLIFIVAHGSDASLFGNIRKFVEAVPKEKQDQVAPSPSPAASLVNSDSGSINGSKTNKESSQDDQKPAASPQSKSLGSLTDERCKISQYTCHDRGNLTACLQFSGEAPKELSLLIQNDGESTLNVSGTLPPKIPLKQMLIHKQQAKKISFMASAGNRLLIVLTAGNGTCMIRMDATKSGGDFFRHLPFYATQATPIHGVYLFLLIAVTIGGTWACCKWGRRGRVVDGVPYQELEMGQVDSFTANNVETTEGWDESWDEDWEDEETVKTPSGNHVGNGSVNGHSRPSKKDGWENDWDD